MIQMQEKKLGDNTYRVTQLGAKKGRAVLIRLFKVIGPALAELASKDLDTAAGPALSKLCQDLNEGDFDFVCDALATSSELVEIATTNTGNKPLVVSLSSVFDEHFRGNYPEMFQWLAFAIEVNFMGFLGGKGLGGLLATIQTKSPSQSPQG